MAVAMVSAKYGCPHPWGRQDPPLLVLEHHVVPRVDAAIECCLFHPSPGQDIGGVVEAADDVLPQVFIHNGVLDPSGFIICDTLWAEKMPGWEPVYTLFVYLTPAELAT